VSPSLARHALVFKSQPKTLPKATLSVDEVERILKRPDTTTPLGLRDRAIFEVLYSTGIRRAEVFFAAVDLSKMTGRKRTTAWLPLATALERSWHRDLRSLSAMIRIGFGQSGVQVRESSLVVEGRRSSGRRFFELESSVQL
jgi:integrase